MKKKSLLFLLPFVVNLVACNTTKQTTVSINYSGDSKPVLFGIDDIKSALKRNDLVLVDGNADYSITISDPDKNLSEQSYQLSVEDHKITIRGGDTTGLMYGALQLAEEINLADGIHGIQSKEESPYIELRGFNSRPSLDCRTPSYTNNGDSTRANVENVWDFSYWTELFDTMARKRYNLFSMANVNVFASMIEVPGYEDVALDDVWAYTGEYDDKYKGNCIDMFRKEHIQEGNYRIVKKMTIQEKTKFWQDVMQYAADRGILFEFSTMMIYTFAEELSNYGITADRDNPITKDYFHKAFVTLIKTFLNLAGIKATIGENMDYPAETLKQTYDWVYYTYCDAAKEALADDPDREEKFWIDFASLGNTTFEETFFNSFKGLPFEMQINKRYNDTRLYSTANNTDNNEYLETIPSDYKVVYTLRNEDAYHYTWGDPDFARELSRNMKNEKVRGFAFGIDGYYVSGKEYEFKEESLNGKLYFDRHWVNYTMFGRFMYNPDGMSNEYWEKLFIDHYEDTGIAKENLSYAWKAMTTAGKILPDIIQTYSPGGTDAAFLPEMCTSNPTLFGFLEVKRFVNNDTSDPDSNVLSFAQYAKALKDKTDISGKRTPFDVANDLRRLASLVETDVQEARKGVDPSLSSEFDNQMLDQSAFALLADYYSYKFDGAMNLRIYNDSSDKTYQDKAVEALTKAEVAWLKYADSFKARFIKERLPRHGVIDVDEFSKVVSKDISSAKKWVIKNYD